MSNQFGLLSAMALMMMSVPESMQPREIVHTKTTCEPVTKKKFKHRNAKNRNRSKR